MITIKTHGIMDYSIGALFLITPYLFGFSSVYFAHDVFTVLGFAVIGYSLLTDYRHSVTRTIPLGMHMTFDVAAGIFAMLAPWIYGYTSEISPLQHSLHWVLGLTLITSAFFTGRERPAQLLAPASGTWEEEERRRKAA